MISDILTKREKINLAKKYKEALSGLGEVINNSVTPKKKHSYIYPLRKAGISRQEAKNLGFKFSKHLWKSCTSTNFRNPGGRPAITDTLKNEIAKHLSTQSVSEIAANRLIKQRISGPRNLNEEFRNNDPKTWSKQLEKIEMDLIPVYNRKISIQESYNTFTDSYFDEAIKFSTFKKYMPKEFKKPFRKTDLCEYCEYGRCLKKNIIEFVKENHEEFFSTQDDNDSHIQFKNYIQYFQNIISSSNLSTHLSIQNNDGHSEFEETENSDQDDDDDDDDDEIEEVNLINDIKGSDEDVYIDLNNILSKLRDLKSVEYHRSIAKRQREAYNLMTSDQKFYNKSILIEFDFKQKIKYGIYLQFV